jgi:NitT/TauT family transport system permease protein
VVFPILYISTIAGFESADPKLLEMAKVFQLSPLKRFLYIYWSTLLPHLTSACKVAVGMSWKAGIAAEVIGVPGHSIGEKLYMAKIYLSTADLFAWNLVIIAISSFFEKIFLKLLDLASCQNKRTENRRTKLWS